MNLLHRLIGREAPPARPRPRPPSRRPVDGAASAADADADAAAERAVGTADERPPGCGWFDSSDDLRHGLSVHEHTDPAAIGVALPLTWWLALHAAADRGPSTDEAGSASPAAPAAGIIAAIH